MSDENKDACKVMMHSICHYNSSFKGRRKVRIKTFIYNRKKIKISMQTSNDNIVMTSM